MRRKRASLRERFTLGLLVEAVEKLVEMVAKMPFETGETQKDRLKAIVHLL